MSKRDKRIMQEKRHSLLQIKLAKKAQKWCAVGGKITSVYSPSQSSLLPFGARFLGSSRSHRAKFYSIYRSEHVEKMKDENPRRDLAMFDKVVLMNPIFDRSLLREINSNSDKAALSIMNPLHSDKALIMNEKDDSSSEQKYYSSEEESSNEDFRNKIAMAKKVPFFVGKPFIIQF